MQSKDFFPDFFYETYEGSVFTNNSFKNKFLLVFFLVHITSKKDQNRLLLYKDLIDDLYRLKPFTKELLQCIAVSSDTVSAMKKNPSDLFNVSPYYRVLIKNYSKKSIRFQPFLFFQLKPLSQNEIHSFYDQIDLLSGFGTVIKSPPLII